MSCLRSVRNPTHDQCKSRYNPHLRTVPITFLLSRGARSVRVPKANTTRRRFWTKPAETKGNKRQRKESPVGLHKQEPIPAMESTQGTGKIMSKVDTIKAKKRPERNTLPASLAQRKLPWKLRSRHADHQASEARAKSPRFRRRNHDRIT